MHFEDCDTLKGYDASVVSLTDIEVDIPLASFLGWQTLQLKPCFCPVVAR